MEKLDLFHAVGGVDDDILEDAEEFLDRTSGKKRTPAWVKWGSLAACAALAACAVWAATRPPVGHLAIGPVAPDPEVAQNTSNIDRPAVEPEELKRLPVELDWNVLAEAPTQETAAMFGLLWDDFVPMTREELLDYYGVSLPVEALFPDLSAVGPEEGDGFGRGIYRRESGEPYFDTNTFSFESADGVLGVNITLDKAFHLPVTPWELPGDELRFTNINGWELALFRYLDGEGNQYFRTEFRQNGVNYRVTGKNMCEQAYAVVLETLLEKREDYAPGAVRTLTGTVTAGISRHTLTSAEPDGSVSTRVTYGGVLGLSLEDGSGYLYVEVTSEQAEKFYGSFSLGDRVTVSFTGEPASIATLWTQQIVDIETAQAAAGQG